ncbi:MAG: type III secretion protein [Phyllobacterium sp.]
MSAPSENAREESAPAPIYDWTSVMATPVRFVHPARIVSCYDGAISLDIARQLQMSDRVQRQLTNLLMDHFDLPDLSEPVEMDQADLGLMAASAEQISSLVPLAGAIFWSHIFVAEIRTHEVSEMKRRIGETAFQFALANRDLAGNLPAPENLDGLETAMEQDGYRCLASWHDALPQRLGSWARLKHASDRLLVSAPEAGQRELGLAIMRRLASNLPELSAQGETQ